MNNTPCSQGCVEEVDDSSSLAEEGDPMDEIIDILDQEFPDFAAFIEDVVAALFGG